MPETVATEQSHQKFTPAVNQRVSFYNPDLNLLFSYESGVFFVGDRRYIVRDHVTAIVIDHVICCHPTIAEYDSVSLLLTRKQNVGFGIGDRATVQRYIHKFSRFWEGIFPLCPLIYNIRGKGYTISSHWRKLETVDADNTLAAMKNDLDKIVNSAIEYLNRSEIVFTDSGTSYVVADPAYRSTALTDLDALFWSIIVKFDETCSYPKLTQIRRLLMDLFSFVTFWRLGDMINEEKWRADYRKEITQLAASIRAELKIEP